MNGMSTPLPNSAIQPVPVSCPLCGQDEPRPLYRSDQPFMQVVRCTKCGLMYQNPRVAETDMPDAYDVIEGYSRFPEQDSAKQQLFQTRIARFQREWGLPDRGNFLELGAARGVMLDCVRKSLPGWQLAAVELSPSARARLIGRGYPAVASLDLLDPEAKFDWINIDNVLEHLPDPRGTLSSLKTRLAPGGKLYIEVPNESFFSVRYRINDAVRGFRKPPTAEGHLNLFTPRSLRMILAAAGLRLDRLWLESVAVPHRLKAALGADETPRVRRVLQLLRATRLDVGFRVAYFICCIVRQPRS